MGEITIEWNNQAMESLMKSPQMTQMEQNIMMNKLSEVRAAFLQEFGFQGQFTINSHTTSGSYRNKLGWHAGRTSYRISANDARTTAALKSQPGWLNRFI